MAVSKKSRSVRRGSKVAKVAPSKAKPVDWVKAYRSLRFSCNDIYHRLGLAERLSTGCEREEWPVIQVKWEPASLGGVPPHDVSHSYTVHVDVPADEEYFDIQGETIEELRAKLAEGLDDRADYYERVAILLRLDAKGHRKNAGAKGGAS